VRPNITSIGRVLVHHASISYRSLGAGVYGPGGSFIFYFFSSFQKATIDWPITNILAPWGHSSKVEAQMWNKLFEGFSTPLFRLYIHGSWTRAKQYGIKNELLFWDCLRGNTLITWRTCEEAVENLMGTQWELWQERIGNNKDPTPLQHWAPW
jgi:hypothetical protein